MCIAILNTKGQIKDKHIKNSWDNNDQGAGMLWNERGQMQTFKTYDYKEFLSKYKELRKNPIINKIVLHFRIATSGHDKYVNLHPFKVNDNLGFVHNGIISGLGDQKHSDTFYFNEMLKKLPDNFLSNDTTRELISNYIGYSKLIFLHSDDSDTIINEHLGHWSGLNWYSNDSYKQSNSFVYFGNEKVSKGTKTAKTTYSSLKDDYFFYENVTSENLKKIATLIGTDIDSYYFMEDLNTLSYEFDTYDLNKIIKQLQEYNSEYNNDHLINY
jgi:hypothetical protein